MTAPDPDVALAEGDLDALRAAFRAASVEGDEDRARWAARFVEAGCAQDARALVEAMAPGELRSEVEALISAAGGEPSDEVGSVAEAAAAPQPSRSPGLQGPAGSKDGDPDPADSAAVPAEGASGSGDAEPDPAPEDDPAWAPQLPPRHAEVERDDAVVQLFLRWFGGRRDIHARQWYSARRGRGGYRPVREPLTEAVARAHLAGRATVGQYLLDARGRVRFGVIDLDVSADALAELDALHGAPNPMAHAPLRKYLGALVRAGARLGLPLFPAASGGRGAHAWIFFASPRPASVARNLLSQVTTTAGPPPSTVELEIFPKQDVPGPRGLSSLVKLPLGRHQRTLAPCPLLDARLEPIEDPRAALEGLEAAPDDVVDALAGRRVVPLPAPEGVPPEPMPPLPTSGGPRSLAERLRTVAPGPEERKAAEAVLERCAALRHLTEKAHRDRALEPAEARAVIYSLGLLGQEPETAKAVLLAAGASLKELHRAKRGTPAPVGCRKVRRLAPEARCAGCPVGEDAVPYATPMTAAVADAPRTPSPPRHAPFASWLGDPPQVVQTPEEKLLEALGRIERRLDRLEEKRAEAAGEETGGRLEGPAQPDAEDET